MFFGIVGYVAVNFDNIGFWLGIAIFIGFILLVLTIFFANQSFDKKLDELERL